MRVLNVLRHWVSKHAQDFELNHQLKNLTIEFLEDIGSSPNLLPAEHKAASQLLRLICKEEPENSKVDLEKLLAPPTVRNYFDLLNKSVIFGNSRFTEYLTYSRCKVKRVLKLYQLWKLPNK